MRDAWIISLGGSLIAPEEIDTKFVANFCSAIRAQTLSNPDQRIVVVCGGGDPARRYQNAYRELVTTGTDDAADWIGIAATRLNAELIKQVFGDLAKEAIVTDPTTVNTVRTPVLVAAGWKPGFSHDYDAVVIAERLKASHIIKLSNVRQIYNLDPRSNQSAKPFEHLSWNALQNLIGRDWVPGYSAPFDPIATKKASEMRLTLVFTGSDIENLCHIFNGEQFTGTVVGPE